MFGVEANVRSGDIATTSIARMMKLASIFIFIFSFLLFGDYISMSCEYEVCGD